MTSDDAFELKSVMQQILAQMKDSAAGTTGARDSYSRRTSELIAHEELSRQATAAATTATNKNTAGMKSLIDSMASFGKKLENLGTSLNKTQNDFGISLASAAKLQVTAFKDSINSFVKLFTSIDFSQLFSEIGEVGSAVADMAVNAAKDFASGKGVANAFTEGGKKIGEVLTKERPGPKIEQFVSPTQIKEATKKFQDEFGVINTEMGTQIATEAKNRGLSVDQLVQARRIFATTAMGDLDKVAGIQSRFFDQFKAKGMTPKVALEAITKYAELIARNGNRFADSFARAAADAKKIGVDLSKVDQIGDSIISDFEGFLEKSAELGAMGFNLDSNVLAQLAESGDTGALFNELRSQLAATGKDITKLRRSEQLALSGAFGLSMSDIQRLAGGTPKANSMEDYAEEGNSLLGKILALMIAGGPLLSVMSNGLGTTGAIVSKLAQLIAVFGPAGAFAALIVGLQWWIQKSKGEQIADLKQKGKQLISEGKIEEGSALLREAGQTSFSSNMSSAGPGAGSGVAYNAQMAAVEGQISAAVNEYYKNNPGKAAEIAKNLSAASTIGLPSSLIQSTVPSPSTTNGIGGRIRGFAEGGSVTGPGTKESDSILAKLSNGEFVMNAASTANIGVDVLNDLNKTGAAGAIGTPLGMLGKFDLLTMVRNKEWAKLTETLGMDGVKTLITKLGGSALLGTVGALGVSETSKAYQEQSKMPWNQGKDSMFWTGTEPGKVPEWAQNAAKRPRFHKGGIAGGKSDELPAILQRGEAVISKLQMGGLTKIIGGMNTLSSFGDKFTAGTAGLKDKVNGMFGGKAGSAISKAQELKAGGTEGLFSMAQNKFGGLFGGKTSRAMSGVSNLLGSESPIGGMMGLASKIPGVGGLLGKATGLLSGGGLKGMAGSLLGKVGLGSLGGSLLGGPATMLGSLAAPLLKKIPFIGGAASALAGGPSKLLGKLGGSALGKIGGLFGKKKESVANMLPPQMQAVLSGGQPGMEGVNFSAMLSQIMGSRQQQQQSPPAAAPEIDTRGIEQKLNNFIAALQGIQINMDGAQVGKVLVNFSDVAGTTGILRPRTSATF